MGSRVSEIDREDNKEDDRSEVLHTYSEGGALKKENLRLRDRALFWIDSIWVQRPIKEMNCKPSCLAQCGLFKPTLGVDFDVWI